MKDIFWTWIHYAFLIRTAKRGNSMMEFNVNIVTATLVTAILAKLQLKANYNASHASITLLYWARDPVIPAKAFKIVPLAVRTAPSKQIQLKYHVPVAKKITSLIIQTIDVSWIVHPLASKIVHYAQRLLALKLIIQVLLVNRVGMDLH